MSPGRRSRRPPLLLPMVLLSLAVLSAQPVAAHGAPPVEDDHVDRVLEDHNDDCGGDGVTGRCGGTLDLVALDLIERWDDAWKADALTFRLLADRGDDGTLGVEIRFTAGGKARTLRLATTDGERFTGDFDRIGAPRDIQDGTRFALEATSRLSSLGLARGDVVSGMAVTATRDGKPGDVMPGGYVTAVGTRVEDPPQGSDPTNRGPIDHPVQGPVRYASFGTLQSQSVQPGSPKEVDVRIANLLRRTPQAVTVTVEAPEGIEAAWKDGGATLRLDLDRLQRVDEALRLEAEPGARGDIRLVLTTSLGGRVEATLPVAAGEASGTGSPTGSPTGAPTGAPTRDGTGDRGSPAPAAAVPAALAVVAFIARRRCRRA